MRIAVEEKAKAFGCADAISNLAIIDAVRFLQHRERCTPCFGWESPLIALPEGATIPPGVDREKLCGVVDCYWKSPCDTHRLVPAASLEECMDEELVRDIEATILHVPVPVPPSSASPAALQPGLTLDPAPKREAIAAQERRSNEVAASALLSRIAESASTFLSAVHELVQQDFRWRSTIGQQLDGLTSRFDQLAQVVLGQQTVNAVVQERYEELSRSVATVREADARHENNFRSLREGTRERMDWFAGRLEELVAQQAQQRDDVSELQTKAESLSPLEATVADLSSRAELWSERLDRQGEALHSLCEAQDQRTAALDQVLEVLSRLRTPPSAPAVKL